MTKFPWAMARLCMAAVVVCLLGCGSPTATPVATVPPPPAAPPAPVVAPPPSPPKVEPKPDPYEVAMTEMRDLLKRYTTVYGGVKDQASADKAVEEIGKIAARLKQLAEEVKKMPAAPGRTNSLSELLDDLQKMPAVLAANSGLQNVLADPEAGIKLTTANLSFASEVIPALAETAVLRQGGGLLPGFSPAPTVPAVPSDTPQGAPQKSP